MKEWKWNPKTKDSGIITCIPQTGRCPNGCEDCFFQSGRSYLEPLNENLPHIPSKELAKGRVVRMNDGNDSNVDRELVEETAQQFDDYFFNTSIAEGLGKFSGPVVLTVNPGDMTDRNFVKYDPQIQNLMFVRIRTNVWNLHNVVGPAIRYYTGEDIPVVLTFMAYHNKKDINTSAPPERHYQYRKRTQNSYWAIKYEAWKDVMNGYRSNYLVYSCGKEGLSSACKNCGNCMREYYNTKERLRA